MILRGVQLYTVYAKPGKDEPEFVKESFNFWAFFFLPFWAIYHRIAWLFVVTIAVQLVTAEFTGLWTSLMQAGWVIYGGFCAADWQGASLMRRGYKVAGVTTGHSLLEAQQRYFDRYGMAGDTSLPASTAEVGA
jgi:hypothetical protein